MVVGTLFLIVATTTIGRIHAGMTFVYVVVGVAILLYGTGTQATGSLDGQAATTAFKLSLAGGAGALAFATAAGIVYDYKKINNAVREEIRYLNLSVHVSTGGKVYLSHYRVTASVDGKEIPIMKVADDTLLAVIPYKLRDRKKSLSLRAEWADPLRNPPPTAKPVVESVEPVVFDVSSRKEESAGSGIFKLGLESSLLLTRDQQTILTQPDANNSDRTKIAPQVNVQPQ